MWDVPTHIVQKRKRDITSSATTLMGKSMERGVSHEDVIKWKHFPRYWPFVRGIHRSPVNSTHKDQ